MKIKIIKCKVCGERFQLYNSLRPYCSYGCGAKYALKLKAKKDAKDNRDNAKETRARKQALLTHKDWIKLYQITFNTFIRERDKGLPCISCGTTRNVVYAAGHFIPTTYQYLRFNELNVHRQCNKNCNMMKSGNLIEYRINLIEKIGLEDVEYLENSRHMMLEISIPEIQDKIKEYKLKIKDLKGV